ncbi:MAG: hypothetical protein ACRDGA_04645, partial [Bacteroidota bacterium]
GLFYIGMLATIMSSLSSLMFISATTLGKDIVGRTLTANKGHVILNESLVEGRSEESEKKRDSSPHHASTSLSMMTGLRMTEGELINRWTKLGLVISALFAIALALLVPSVVSIWYTIGTCIIPGLLVPVLASYFDKLRIPASYAFTAMLLGWLTSTASLLFGLLDSVQGAPTYFYDIEPMYPGLLVGLAVWGVGKMKVLNSG